MKFIRTVGGDYVNAAYVRYFEIQRDNSIMAHAFDEDEFTITEQFDSRETAQEWLDSLIDDLESEED